MPTFVYMTRCDGCGYCVDICPSDIMHIDKTYRRAYNIEPNMCLGVLCLREGVSAECHRLPRLRRLRTHGSQRSGAEGRGEGHHFLEDQVPGRQGKGFRSPIRTTPWGSIRSPADYEAPAAQAMKSQELAHEPDALHIEALPALTPDRFKVGAL